MCSASASSSNLTLDSAKLVKFVELLVHDYLQVKGFTATGEKFAQECSNCARDRDTDSSKKNRHGSGGSADSTASNGESAVDEAGSWYYLADKLALPVGWIPACGALFVDDNISVPYTEMMMLPSRVWSILVLRTSSATSSTMVVVERSGSGKQNPVS